MSAFKSDQKKKNRKGRISSVVIFMLVFVLFLVIFGGLCLWTVIKINEEKRRGAASSLSSTASAVSYTEADSRNLLVISEDNGQAQGFVIVRLDPANTRIRTMALPRETSVDVGTQPMCLYQLYSSQGAIATEQAVSKLMGMDFQNYAVVTYSNLEKIITYLNNGVIFTLTENLDYISEDGSYYIKLSGGRTTLTASQVVGVLRYPSWHAGRRQQAEIHSEMLSAILNQYITTSRKDVMDDDFNAIIDKVNSDIKISHYVAMKDPLLYLASKNSGNNICSSVQVAGSYVGTGENLRFEVSLSDTGALKNSFGLKS